jgi:hypothetical protein
MIPQSRVLTSPEEERRIRMSCCTNAGQFDFDAFDELVGQCPDPPSSADDADVAAFILALHSFYDNCDDEHLYPAPPAVLTLLDHFLCLDPEAHLATAALEILRYVSATSRFTPAVPQILDFAFWESPLDCPKVPVFFDVLANLLEWFPPAFQADVAEATFGVFLPLLCDSRFSIDLAHLVYIVCWYCPLEEHWLVALRACCLRYCDENGTVCCYLLNAVRQCLTRANVPLFLGDVPFLKCCHQFMRSNDEAVACGALCVLAAFAELSDDSPLAWLDLGDILAIPPLTDTVTQLVLLLFTNSACSSDVADALNSAQATFDLIRTALDGAFATKASALEFYNNLIPRGDLETRVAMMVDPLFAELLEVLDCISERAQSEIVKNIVFALAKTEGGPGHGELVAAIREMREIFETVLRDAKNATLIGRCESLFEFIDGAI